MKKKLILVLTLLTFVVTSAGCVKVVKIGEEGKYTGKVEFSASDSVSDMWDDVVEDITSRAVELPTFLQEANGDLKSLADQYGKYSMGTSGAISYPVKGTGKIIEVENGKKAGYMVIELADYTGSETIKIQIGSIYKGSSTRDTLTIINFGDYTNQEEWAAISQQLHTMIHKNVITPANPADLEGKTISFVGTFTADANDELVITPISIEVQ